MNSNNPSINGKRGVKVRAWCACPTSYSMTCYTTTQPWQHRCMCLGAPGSTKKSGGQSTRRHVQSCQVHQGRERSRWYGLDVVVFEIPTVQAPNHRHARTRTGQYPCGSSNMDPSFQHHSLLPACRHDESFNNDATAGTGKVVATVHGMCGVMWCQYQACKIRAWCACRTSHSMTCHTTTQPWRHRWTCLGAPGSTTKGGWGGALPPPHPAHPGSSFSAHHLEGGQAGGQVDSYGGLTRALCLDSAVRGCPSGPWSCT